jgi:hypothetical protein
MKAHIEAQQARDIRNDLARRLRPTDGPFEPGTRVFYWDCDSTKLANKGRWLRGLVVAFQPPMVSIDTGRSVIRVNETKVRKDHDPWHDVPIPGLTEDPDDRPISSLKESKVSGNPKAALADSISEDILLSEDIHPSLWQATTHGKINFLEMFAGSAHLFASSSHHGLAVGSPIDLRTGFDLMTRSGQEKAWHIIVNQRPDVVFMAPVCTPFSQLRNSAPPEIREAERKRAMPMVHFCVQVALHQRQHKRWFLIENPTPSAMWKTAPMAELSALAEVSWDSLDMCCYGLRDPLSKQPYKKSMCLMHNLPPDAIAPVFRKCRHQHTHQKIEGYCKGYGSRSYLPQIYMWAFCNQLSRCLADFLDSPSHPTAALADTLSFWKICWTPCLWKILNSFQSAMTLFFLALASPAKLKPSQCLTS